MSTPVVPVALTTGFPDLFIATLTTQLQAALTGLPDFSATSFFMRPLRPTDPNWSVGIFEADVEPIEYEIGQLGSTLNANPSLLRWNVAVQVLSKAGSEEEGRAIRAKLLNRVRATLFSVACINALMVLNDSSLKERVTKYRWKRVAFASGDLTEQKAKFFIGQVEMYFDTESY